MPLLEKRQVDLFRTRTIGVDPSDGISCPNLKKLPMHLIFSLKELIIVESFKINCKKF